MNDHNLSPDHPLRRDPNRYWPYLILLGLRAPGSRKVVDRRSVYVGATSEAQARRAGLTYGRSMPAKTKDGQRLIVSRVISSRPLDKGDANGSDL